MDKLTDKLFNEIAEAKSDYCASLYMPTSRTGQEATQGETRLKNLVRETKTMLQDRGMKDSDIEKLVKPAEDLYLNSIFWQKQSEGLVLFLSLDHQFIFRVPVRFEKDVVIAPKFHLKPLFPLYNRIGGYYILSLSKNQIRLFEANQYGANEVDLTDLDIPLSLEEATKYDVFQGTVGRHSAQTGTRSGASIVYGQGFEEDEKGSIERFLKVADNSINSIFNNQPVILAGVDYILSIYRNVSDYDHIMDEAIVGSPDEKSGEQLQQESFEFAKTILTKPLLDELELYNQLLGQKSSKIGNEISTILKSAHSGRVKTAFLKIDKKIWGTFDEDTLEVTFADEVKLEHVDLLELIARYTHMNSGDVYVLKENQYSDDHKDAFAIYRY